MTWRDYHEVTKHNVQALRRSGHVLDWTNMPDPFRHYEGVPMFDLPAEPPGPEVPALDVLQGAHGRTAAADGAAFLSQLLYYSSAISASKRVLSTGYRYALRVNPSSGNLHPTEFHFLTRGLKQWPDGLYHYRPSSHMAEQRAAGPFKVGIGPDREPAPLVFVLTSIAWREAWKYRDRAYRYCLHDIGHAWQSLALAARSMGCETFANAHFPDDEIARLCRLNEDEWPMLAVEVRSNSGAQGGAMPARDPDGGDAVWFGGRANQLSDHRIPYAWIDAMHSATKLESGQRGNIATAVPPGIGPDEGLGAIELPPPASSTRPFGETARTRRSALDFRPGAGAMTLAQLSAILAVTAQPLSADFAGVRFIRLYLYIHRVHELEPGVYRYGPEDGRLNRIRSGDQRAAAAGLSLGQDLAGNACVAFSMIADLDRAVRAHGDRGYRYVHFEAGAIGQRLYLAAEALGFGATGIGAFFDDDVHRYLNLASGQGQVVYHFAIGYPVHDPRLAVE